MTINGARIERLHGSFLDDDLDRVIFMLAWSIELHDSTACRAWLVCMSDVADFPASSNLVCDILKDLCI